MKRFLIFLSFALILAGAVPGKTSGAFQDRKLILTGTVYDTNHAVVAYSQVVAQSLEGKEYWTTANDAGVYKFEIPLARYKIEANAPGFCPRRVGLFGLSNSGTQRPIDLVLEVRSDQPCAQKTMIKREHPTRKPELFRSIAEQNFLARHNGRTSR